MMRIRSLWIVFALSVLFIFQAVPGPAQEVSAKPSLEAGLFCDIFTLAELSNRPAVAAGYLYTGEDFAEFAERPAFLSAGFYIRRGWLKATMMVDLHQDIGAWLSGGAWSNLPKAADSWSLMWGNNYPQVGYAEASQDCWLVSAGRRRIGMGPGSYGLAFSSGNPWYDHVLASFEAPIGKQKLQSGSVPPAAAIVGYSFATLGVQRYWGTLKKNLFIHRAWLRTKRFSIALGELNLVVGDSVDLQDIGPFLIYHHLFNSNSNVMLQIEVQARPVDALRLYGECVLDDFRIPTEPPESNPNAMGFMAGAEWTILKDAESPRRAYFRADHGIRLDARPLGISGQESGGASGADDSGGLRLKAESYLASTYLYRRSASSPNESWTTRYMVQSSTSLGSQVVEPFFAAPIGPDTWLNRLELVWDSGRLETAFAAEYRILGADSGKKDYAFPYAASWIGPQDPVTRRLDFVLKALYAPDERLVLTGGASISFRESETRMSLQVGAGYRFGIGANQPSR
jgi:hypothetical protein